jgi:hypothetical protein
MKKSKVTTKEIIKEVQPTKNVKQEVQPKLVSISRLGRKVKEYDRLREKGISEEKIQSRMADDALIFEVDLDNYLKQIADHKNKEPSKRTIREQKRKAVQDKHMTMCGFLNQIITTGKTDLLKFQTTLKDTAQEANGWVLMTTAGKDEVTGEILFTLNDSGWSDGGRRNQYSDRPQMVKGKVVKHPYPFVEQASGGAM